jgi:hypothetical protein
MNNKENKLNSKWIPLKYLRWIFTNGSVGIIINLIKVHYKVAKKEEILLILQLISENLTFKISSELLWKMAPSAR